MGFKSRICYFDYYWGNFYGTTPEQNISSINITLSEDVYREIDEIFLDGQNVACW